MKRVYRALAALALTAAASLPAFAQDLEKKNIELGVGGKPLLYYLPLTIAEQKGFFKEEGLTVTINDFGGGAKSLQSLIGGSVDAVTGAYEHTLRMQTKGQAITAVLELGRFPGIVLAVRKDQADKVKSAADLKGMIIGVSAPGSSTHIFAQYLMVKAGLATDAASFVGVGSGASAVAAMQKGEIQAISHLDPVIAKLEADKAVKVLVDTRTLEGTQAVFGATNPAAVLYLKSDFIAKNPKTTQALTNALYKALMWIAKAAPEDITETVPQDYWLGDKALYTQAVAANLASYSRTGVIPESGQKAAAELLTTTDAEFKNVKLDLGKTFDGRFVAKAREAVK